MERNNCEDKFGSGIAMLGCLLAKSFRVVHTILHEVMGK